MLQVCEGATIGDVVAADHQLSGRNSGELASRYRKLGGRMELIVVPGKGHEVCPELFRRQISECNETP